MFSLFLILWGHYHLIFIQIAKDVKMDVIDRFISIVETSPDLIAINAADGEITYEGLRGQAEKFACYLASIHGKSALLVGPRSPAMYAAILGCLGSGCMYSVASEDLPIDKFEAVLLQFKPDVIFMNVQNRFACDPTLSGYRICSFTSILGETSRTPLGSAGRVAYVVFTSGTTGQPKGVVIGRAALNHYVSQLEHTFRVVPGDRVSQHPELSFDLSVCDTFGALCFGGTLYPFAGEDERLRPARKIRDNGITHWNSVPSVMNLIAVAGDMTPERMGSVKVFHFCGEPLATETVRSIFCCCPDAVVIASQ
jgi:D-alanine--poly(phosphoribitol) ligase subunit 1